jgi:uncharacterized OsmC-like protein
MSDNLNEFLEEKRQAIVQRQQIVPTGPNVLRASTRAEGRSGVRRIRIREFQIISDSGPDFAGYNLGPSSPELQLGVLSSCITHVFLIQAAQLNVPLDSLEVEAQGELDSRAGKPGFEHVPIYPHNLSYNVHIRSSASDEELAALHEAVERSCPILNLLINPQQISGAIVRIPQEETASQVR